MERKLFPKILVLLSLDVCEVQYEVFQDDTYHFILINLLQ